MLENLCLDHISFLNKIIIQRYEYQEINKTLIFIFFIILFVEDYIVFKKV